MLLLYRKPDHGNYAMSVNIYIPLCFYFICMGLHNGDAGREIYIPLCFYFIGNPCTQWFPGDFHLHSTMLLLYPDPPGSPWASYFIYIPLCFYFIKEHLYIRRGKNIFTFHYASTLSKHQIFPDWKENTIYIPLCFYFISALHRPRSQRFSIYIPLCFYFIVSIRNGDVIGYIFTFHYASTLSNSLVGNSALLTLFTFHYASTLSGPIHAEKSQQEIHLHSTMLLLYPAGTD